MEKFSSCFIRFKKNGCFSLADATLTIYQLVYLYCYILEHKTLLKTFDCEFSMSNIMIFPELTDTPNLLTLPADIIYLNEMQKKHKELDKIIQTPLSSKSSPDRVEALLNDILNNFDIEWSNIRLENARFNNPNRYLNNPAPLSRFLISEVCRCHRYNSRLAVFSLMDVNIDYPLLADLLKASSSLQWLQLKPLNLLNTKSLKLITTALYLHPSLKNLKLFDEMNLTQYQELNTLLDNNYRIELILIPSHQEQDLWELRRQLFSRLVQDNLERFIQEQLNQSTLFDLAFESITQNKPDTLELLLKTSHSLLGICSNELRQIDMANIQRHLPPVYYGHREFMEYAWAKTNLDFSVILPGTSETIGIRLLYEAFNQGDPDIIQTVFDSCEKFFNRSAQFNRCLIKKLFESNKNYPWKKIIIEYFQQDLSIFSPWINKLTPYRDILSNLTVLHQCLNSCLTNLLELNHRSHFMRMMSKSTSWLKVAITEWEDHFNHLIKGIQRAGKRKSPESLEPDQIIGDSFIELYTYIDKIIVDLRNSELDFRNKIIPQDEISHICTKLITNIKPYFIRSKKPEIDSEKFEAFKIQLVQEKETMQQEMKLIIEQLEEKHAQITKKMKEEMDSKIEAKMQHLVTKLTKNNLVANEEPQTSTPLFFKS